MREIPAREAPVQGARNGLVVLRKPEDAVEDGALRREVRRGEGFVLENGTVSLDLIEPTRVHRQMDEDEGRPANLEPVDRPLPPMDGAVVDYPEDATRRAVRYGACSMTSATNASNTAIEIVASTRPNSTARCTSHAATYAHVSCRL